MNFYGSELWYKARDNSGKLSITLLPSAIEGLTRILEDNNICYYGFDNGRIGKISVDRSDIDLIKALVGEDRASVMTIEEITKPYTPPEKNVFGTIEYKYIAKNSRRFLTGESEPEQKAILRTAELLKREGVQFSGRAYKDKITLTLNEQDLDKAKTIYQEVLTSIEKAPETIAQDRIDSNIKLIIENMSDMGFDEKQLSDSYSSIIKELAAFNNADINDYITHLDPAFTFLQNTRIFSLLNEIHAGGGFDYITPSTAQDQLLQLEKEFRTDLLLQDYFIDRHFNSEQKASIREISFGSDSLPPELKYINETFSPEEIRKLHELWQNDYTETAEQLSVVENFISDQQQGKTGIGYTDSFTEPGNGTVQWMHRSFDEDKGEVFRIYTVTYKELLLAQSMFDDPKDVLEYLGNTSNFYETKSLPSPVFMSYRSEFARGNLYGMGDASFLERIGEVQAQDISIFTLEDMAIFISVDITSTISEDQLRQLIEGKTNELMSNGGVDKKLSGYSRSDVLLLCSELKGSPFAEKISSNLTAKIKSELLRKGVEITENDVVNAEHYTTEQLVEITETITGKQEEITRLVANNEFEKAKDIYRELSVLAERAAKIKASIQESGITQDDISALRDIEPKRKSIQNMTEPEVAQTPKIERLLGDELGEKSPYEMRRGNLAWREDETAVVPIIEIETRNVSDIMGDVKKGLIQRGNFVNDDTNMIINVGQTGIRDTLAHSLYDSKRGENTTGRLSSLYQLESIIKSAVCFDTVISEIGKNKSPNTLFMHKLYAVIMYENNPYLVQLSVEESYSTNRDGSMRGTDSRFYNLKDIKIAPIRLNAGFQSHGIPSEDDRAKPYGAIIELTIPQLYTIVKEYDQKYYENEQAPGRAEREAEIAAQHEFERSVKKLDEHNADLERDRKDIEIDESVFMRYAVEQLVNNTTVRNAHENSDNSEFRTEVQTEIDKLITQLTINRESLSDWSEKDASEFLNEYSGNAELRKSIFDIVSADVDTALTELEQARKFAKKRGIPFSDQLSDGVDDDINPYVYDGSMSPEDFEKYQQLNELADSIIDDSEKLPDILRRHFSTDEIPDLAYTLGISPRPFYTKENIDTPENIAKRQFAHINESVYISSDKDSLGVAIRLNGSEEGLTVTNGNENSHLYSWFDVGSSMYKMALEFMLRDMYSEIIAEARLDGEARLSRADQSSDTKQNYPIANARKTEITDERLIPSEDGKGFSLICSTKRNGIVQNDVVLQSFETPAAAVQYLREHNYMLTGFGIKPEVIARSEYTGELTPPIPDAPQKPDIPPDSLEFSFGKMDRSAITFENGIYDTDFTESGELSKFLLDMEIIKGEKVSYALANAVIAYLDEKQHIEREDPENHVGWYDKTDFYISAVIGGIEFGYEGRYDIGDGKGTGGGTIADHIRAFVEWQLKDNPFKLASEELAERQQYIDVFIPFLEAHSQLTEHEQEIFDQFKRDNPIRREAVQEKRSSVKYQIMKKIESGNIDDGPEFTSLAEAQREADELLADGYEGYCIYNTDTKEIVRLGGNFTDYDLVDTFSVNVLRLNNREDLVRESLLRRAQRSISDFCSEQYDSEPDFSDLGRINIAYTTDEQTELDIQIYVDLYSLRIITEYDNQPVHEEKFDSLEDMCKALDELDFDELVSLSDEEKAISDKSKTEQRSTEKEDTSVSTTKTVVLRKAGAFYEMHGENADIGEHELFLTRTGDKVGFPNHKLDEYSKELREAGYEVLIEEAFEINSSAAERKSVQLSFDDVKQEAPETAAETADTSPVTAEKPPKAENYRITDDHFADGTKSERFERNLAAIRTLKQIESENRTATPQEQEILAKYVGWGGLADYFKEDNPHYSELKDLLTPDEYRSARASTLDSFYTAPEIISGIYSALESFGFNGGSIIEPSCGVGNFFGMMPQEMQEKSKLYGVELDSLTGRIAKQLYPNADITIDGFQNNDFQNGSFDVAVGNVPFASDTADYDGKSLQIHDYFFAEALDKVRPGGVVAFITSKGTLDKKDSTFRRMLAEKADLIGAVRLPNNAFKRSAGTEVTSDIIFLQKREVPPKVMPDWILRSGTEIEYTDETGETRKREVPINRYFAQHPEMVLGTIVEGSKMYGRTDDTAVIPFEGANLREQLENAVKNLSCTMPQPTNIKAVRDQAAAESTEVTPPEGLRNNSFFIHDGRVYYKHTDSDVSLWERKGNENKNFQKMQAFIELRDMTRKVISAQLDNCSDEELAVLQQRLNTAYDRFYNEYGLLHSTANATFFDADISFYLVCSLESEYDDKSKTLLEKSPIFSKRTIKPIEPVTHVDSAQEALTMTMAEKGRVDIEYMQALTDMKAEDIISDLRGQIFPVPELSKNGVTVYQEKSEYLSGDIYKKLEAARSAAEHDSQYELNVMMLEQSIPEPIKSGDIDIKIGATWIDPKYYQQFMYEVFNTPSSNREDKFSWWGKKITVDYSPVANSWVVNNKTADRSTVVTRTYGTDAMNAYKIMEYILNLREPKVYKTVRENGQERRVLDLEATRAVTRRAEKIKQEFKKWIFADPARRKELTDTYNRTFNSIRPRVYDGSALTFPGMSPDIRLREHQKNAVAHALYGGNTLFAHTVGAGKTFEMIATAMESKRLGLCNKPLFVVPNHLTAQFGADFARLYPGSNLLVATKRDFEKANRQKLFARIATGEYDGIIIGHSQLGKIPMSVERQREYYTRQIDDIVEGIAALKSSSGSSFQVKAMERTKKSLEKSLQRLQKADQDEGITFEEMGIDKLIVDEVHEFKNLFCATKLQNVAGISNTASQKASDLFQKCRYLDEITGGRGITFATGTPVSNSITELHTMMRYLQYDYLQSVGLANFDNWVSIFGEQKAQYELAPAGNKFKLRTRIANYTNLPELMTMFRQCSDVRTADTLHLSVPKCNTVVVNAKPSELQQALVEELSARSDDVQAGKVDPSQDNLLKITSDGRKVGLDPRLIDPTFEDDPNSKLNLCVENVIKIYNETSPDRLTQLIFCDLGVPHGSNSSQLAADKADDSVSVINQESYEESGDFCVYDDIKRKLMEIGHIPEKEIAFIHDAKTEAQKDALFAKVRSGEIRVLLGSTPKMGTGTNIQDRLVAMHDLDIPWRPADLERAPVKAAI